eukprot:scaffold8734_cov50-Phaeocystis_antarctica.AAC.3
MPTPTCRSALVRQRSPCWVVASRCTRLGVGFRHMQIAGCGRASSRDRFCPVTHASIRASSSSWPG